MHFEGHQTIESPVTVAWDFFMDPHRVSACAPGFQSLEVLTPEHFRPTIAVGVGPVKATFTLDATLADVRPPEHVTMNARGTAAGSAVDMRGDMSLTAESDSSTGLAWSMDVTVSGTLASVGSRLMESTAQRLTARFFDCIRSTLASPSKAAASGGD